MKSLLHKHKDWEFYYIKGPTTCYPIVYDIVSSINISLRSISLNNIIERVDIPGILHNEHGPAIVTDRDDYTNPFVTKPDKEVMYYLNGIEYTYEGWKKFRYNICKVFYCV